MFCKHCTSEKPESDFYAGCKSKCKECTKADVREHRQQNLEKVRAYDNMRGSMPHRVAARKDYAKTDAYAKSHRASAKRWSEKHPERRKASNIVNNAVRDGRLIPWPVCAVPECCGKPQGHHPDYSRPMDVVWLCSEHHSQAHKIAKEIST